MKKAFAFMLALSLGATCWYSCQKEQEPTLSESASTTVSEERGPVDGSLCKRKSVTFDQLVDIHWEYDPAANCELDYVFQNCYGKVFCTNTSDPEVKLGFGYESSGLLMCLPPINDATLITPQQQDCIIDYFYNIAVQQAPICPIHGTKKVVRDIDFMRNSQKDHIVFINAKYSCCSNTVRDHE